MRLIASPPRPISSAVIAAFAVFGAACNSPASANDTAAELSVGGLVFTKSADVVLQSEELAISMETIRIRYQFLNQSARPVTLRIAFALPDLDLAEADSYSVPVSDSQNFVGFQTRIGGKPVELAIYQRAFLGEKDVTKTLQSLGVPLVPPAAEHAKFVDALPAETRAKLIDEGLLVPWGHNDRGQQRYHAGWTVKTSAIRQQAFPPGQPVVVDHRYRTSLGMSFDTVLRQATRNDRSLANEVARYRKEYCVSDQFLKQLDKIAGDSKPNTAKVQERRINYVLKTGANWAGPIQNFRLTVDRGKADRLVSFCAPNIKDISPTVSEVVLKDFTPDRDLKILIVGQF